MAVSSKISSALASRTGAPVRPVRPALPNVAGGQVASGARNVASVQPGPIEEAGAADGISYEESGLLFNDYARGGVTEAIPASKAQEETVAETGADGLELDSVFQVQELLGDRRTTGTGVRQGKLAIFGAIRSYADTQNGVENEQKALGEKLSIKL